MKNHIYFKNFEIFIIFIFTYFDKQKFILII